jgi:hypothetical protein
MTWGGSHLGFPIGIKNRGPSNDHSWADSFYIGPIVFFLLPGERYRLLRASGYLYSTRAHNTNNGVGMTRIKIKTM